MIFVSHFSPIAHYLNDRVDSLVSLEIDDLVDSILGDDQTFSDLKKKERELQLTP